MNVSGFFRGPWSVLKYQGLQKHPFFGKMSSTKRSDATVGIGETIEQGKCIEQMINYYQELESLQDTCIPAEDFDCARRQEEIAKNIYGTMDKCYSTKMKNNNGDDIIKPASLVYRVI